LPAQDATTPAAPHLRRVLGQRDLVLLFIVAVANLNVVPAIAADGPVTLWLWLLALVLFFWPQGIAVIELSTRYPQEGGVYLWTKELFGDFHGFLSGWCYWTNNVFYVPTLLFYLAGISVYVGGPRWQRLGENRPYMFLISVVLLWLLVWLNVRGLGVGKWINNLGGLGTMITAGALVGLALAHWRLFGLHFSLSELRVAGADWHLLSSFGVICFGLVGLELGSIMGDEIREPRRTIPRAVAWGGFSSGILYISATLALLLALPSKDISVVQGILQAVSRMAGDVGVGWMVPPVAFVLTLAIAGTASAWLSGSARIPFVAGLDRYLPSGLGKLHPRYDTPYVAIMVHAALSCLFIGMSLVGAGVEEAYRILLLLAVVLQLVPFLYLYAALVRLAARSNYAQAFYKRGTLWAAGISGFATTALGMGVAFVPPAGRHEPVWLFELKMLAGCMFFVGLAVVFFYVYSRRKERSVRRPAAAEAGARGEGG
jgi:glutamate:GABA antiporter